MKFTEGEKAKVIANGCCHDFKIGEIVTIVSCYPAIGTDVNYYEAENETGGIWGAWCVLETDIEKI